MLALLAIAGLFSLALAQQYQGATITNSLPTATGARVAYFNIKAPNGGNTTLINYYSRPGGQAIDPVDVQRAIIVITGQLRDPWVYFASMYNGLDDAAALSGKDISEENVAILVPFWANEADAGTGYPATNGVSTTNVLVWEGKGWSNGEDSTYPTGKSTSSFDALDQIIQYFDGTAFPNLKEIIVAGHSRGAQMVQRYAAVAKQLNVATPVIYWVANPNSFMWWNNVRPQTTANCPQYNNWPEGLDNYYISYNKAAVTSSTPAQLKAIYDTRDIAYARGLNDHGDLSDDCSPYTTGPDRGLRNAAYMTAFHPNSDDTLDYNSGIGHNAPQMILAQSGLYRLFIDNFTGDGSRIADFGPRQVTGDNPHPTST